MAAPPPGRSGITLLEVLVACGILVVGLASLAAVLPAASSLLSQATQADRTGVMTANAYADVVNRGLLSADLFPSSAKACVFGKVLQDAPTASNAAKAVAEPAVQAKLDARIDSATGFLLQDELVYRPPTNAETPLNSFVAPGSRIRRYNTEGMCWGAMISSTTAAVSGAAATLSIAVFKKEGAAPKEISLNGQSGMFKMRTPNESDLKRYLPGCSFVLALSSSGGQPRWFRIASSWKQPNGADCWIVFENHSDLTSFAGADPTVVAFENLLRVEQYPVTID